MVTMGLNKMISYLILSIVVVGSSLIFVRGRGHNVRII